MTDHALPFDVDDEPVPKPYRYKFGATTVEWADDDVIAFHASVKYVEVVLRGEQRRPLLEDPLKALIDDPRYSNDFIQVHRATVVRLSEIKALRRITKNGCFEVELHCGLTFAVSRRCMAPARRALAALAPA
uniref:LytTr DNA-binding domain n=1 Tax=Pseudomonas phage HRDY3 TaxID=3236930 RepID=A0AB39CEF1_9VIRU